MGKVWGNNIGKRELVQKMHGLGDFWDWDDENEWDGKGKKVMLKCECGIY